MDHAELSRRGLLAVVAAASAGSAWAAKPAAGTASRAAAQRLLEEGKLPSLSVAVVRGGKVAFAEAYGLADLETRAAATTRHLYRIGSCSKVVTAVVVGRLLERGTIGLDVPIATYLPTLPEAYRQTTLRQLLGHQGGVRHYILRDFDPKAPGGPIDLRNYPKTADALAVFIDDPLLSAPGKAYHYSTFGFTLIAAALEAASGKRFTELVAAEVATPLGLRILADTPANLIPDRARPYQKAAPYLQLNPEIVGETVNAPPVNPAYKWAGGGLMASATDLARFGQALVRPGHLKAETLATMFTVQVPSGGPAQVPVGLAWRIDKDPDGRRRWHHAGSIEGGRSALAVYPDHDLCVALATNKGDTIGNPLPPLGEIAAPFLA